MPYYKDTANGLHFLDSASFAYLLPAGSVEITDAEAASMQAASVTLAQQAASAIGAGLTIALSGTMTLAGTLFPTDAETTNKLAAVVTTLTATSAFPGGGTTYPMKDSAGAWHTFTVNQYKAVAAAIAGYVSALTLIADGNPLNATALPSSSISLTV